MIKRYGPFDLKKTEVSESILIDSYGPISIQTIGKNICGSPKFTFQVSNLKDEESFTNFNFATSNLDISDSILLDYQSFPWKYVRILTHAESDTSGFADLIISLNNRPR